MSKTKKLLIAATAVLWLTLFVLTPLFIGMPLDIWAKMIVIVGGLTVGIALLAHGLSRWMMEGKK